MADDLDLTMGDPSAADPETPSQRRRRRRSSGSDGESKSRGGAVEAEIRSRLDRTFDRIAKAREARGDEELADVIREDSEAMAQGFISLTTTIAPLRMPLIMLLNLLEPILAFGRVGRILGERLVMRRQQRQAEQQAEMAAAEAEFNGGGGEVPVA